MVASILERTGTRLVHNRAGANMAGGVAAALAAARAASRGDIGPVRGRRVLARPGRGGARAARACCSATCSATSSTATASWRSIADRWAAIVAGLPAETALVLNADDPLVADLGRAPRGAVLRRPGRRAGAARAAARVGLQALPPLRRTPTSTRPPTSATSAATTAPTAARAGPSRAVVASAVELRGIRSARVHAAHAGRRRAGSSSRSPASTTSTTRSAPRRCACALGVAARRHRRRAGGGRARVRPRRDGRARRPPTSILLVKNPAGANEVLRTLALEGGELDLLRRAQRPHRRRARRLVGVGRRLRAASRRTCGG